MLKLKYLFDNSELALMLLKNWSYDEESLTLFKYFRISSNAIYPFKNQGKLYFLRFVPGTEKDAKDIVQELSFIELLSENGLNVPKIIKSHMGNLIETKHTPWGTYHAVVFESVGEETLEEISISEDIAYAYGTFLAKLHQISSSKVKSAIDRVSVFDVLDLLEEKAAKEGTPLNVLLTYVKQLKLEFKNLETTEQTFGLIHFDFELDNIIYDIKTDKLFAIDFDDCMYGFYGQDVERAINSIESEIDEMLQDSIKASFIKGYLDEGGDLTVYQANKELFKAFADLYAFFRVKDALEENWDNEPLWMVNLRNRLSERLRLFIEKLES